ncbi:hypothetical protein [Burkholderia cepacia]|uniref:hypothetical protein n=1 Tax=Burkholderia cepacia TaxID=292 RepID=UPI002FE0699D
MSTLSFPTASGSRFSGEGRDEAFYGVSERNGRVYSAKKSEPSAAMTSARKVRARFVYSTKDGLTPSVCEDGERDE